MRRTSYGLRAVARHDRERAPPRAGRAGRRARATGGSLPDVRRQVGEEAADLVERVVLVGGLVVDRAGAGLRARAAELLLVRRLAHRRGAPPAGRRRRAARCRARSPRSARPRRAPRRARRPGRARPPRPARRERFSTTSSQPGHERHVGEAHRLEVLHAAAAARPVDEPHERQRAGRAPSARRSTIFCQIAASAAPPRTVKSSPCTTARRPSIRPWPMTMFAGRKSVELAVLVVGRLAGDRARSRGSCRRRRAARSARGRSAARSRAGARRAPRRPSAARAPRAGAAPRALAPSSGAESESLVARCSLLVARSNASTQEGSNWVPEFLLSSATRVVT